MNWPLSQDYNEAVQSAKSSFADPDLKAGEVVPGPMGLPMPRSGNFADVYQLRGADGRMWAVKCFTRQVDGLAERYARIDQHLRTARLPFTVGFRFLPEGIRVRGKWFPILKMEWVEGFTLNEFVRQQAGKADQLRALLGMWIRLCKRLRDANIAHADLQHGNVLLVPGETANKLKLRLIDYDGMWVPSLAGKPSGEAGHPAYQHPGRLKERVYSADVDRFPNLVMGCALRAVAIAGKSLWDKFDNGDNLLFREADFAEPSKSKVFKALWELDDPTVTNLLALLVVCSRRPLKDTPWLDDLLSGEKAEPVSDAVLARAADVIGVAHRTARKAAPVAQIYVVPEEANAFADLGADWNDPTRPAVRHRSKASPAAMIAAGGVALAATAVVVAILLSRGNKDVPPHDPGTKQTTGTTKSEPSGSAKAGQLKTEWVALPSGLPSGGAKALVDGLDNGASGKFLRPYPGRGTAALGAWLLADGAHAVVARSNGIGILDLSTGKIEPAVQDISAIRAAVTPDAKYAVIADQDRVIRIFEMRTGLEVLARTFPGDSPALRITPDGKRVSISAVGVGYAEWSLPDGKELRRHESLQASLMAFSLDGTRAIAADKDGGVELWDMDEGKATVLSPSLVASAICITADGKRGLVASTDTKEIRVWELKDGKSLPGHPVPIKHNVTAIASAVDGTIIVGSDEGEVGFIPDSGPGEIDFTTQPKDAITGFALTADGKHVLVATEKTALYLSRVRPKVARKIDLPVSADFLDLALSMPIAADANFFAADANGDRFLIATKNRLTIYDTASFRETGAFRVADTEITAAGFGPDGLVVICEREGETYRTRIIDVAKLEPGTTFAPPISAAGPEGGRVFRVVPVPERKFVIASTAVVGDVLYDGQTGKPATGWPTARRDDQVVAAARPDGQVIAFGSNVKPIQIWDCNTAKFRLPFEASQGFRRLAFTPDGSKLIGLGIHGRIRVWDAETGKVIKDVDHNDPGPLAELSAITNDLLAVAPVPGWMLINLESGKSLGITPDVLAGRGFAIPKRGLIVTANAENRLAAWKLDPKRAAAASARPPRKSQWPDVKLVRDASLSPPVGIAFVDGGKKVIAASQSGLFTRYSADRLLFDAETDVADLPLREMVQAGEHLFTLGRKSVVIRNADSREKVAEFPVTLPTGATPVVFAAQPDGSAFLIGIDKVRLIEVKSKKEMILATPKAAGVKPLTQFAYSADGKSAVARWGNAVTTVWLPKQTGEGKVLEDLKTAAPAAPDALALSPDGKIAVLGTCAGEIKAWDLATGKLIHSEMAFEVGGEAISVEAVRFLPDGTRFLAVAKDGRIVVWSPEGFAKMKEYQAPPGAWQIAVAPDGRSLILAQSGMMAIVGLEK